MSAISNLSLSQAQITDAAKQSQHGDFASMLNRPGTGKAANFSDEQKREIREAAQQLVSSALILPMLAQIRESSLKSELFSIIATNLTPLAEPFFTIEELANFSTLPRFPKTLDPDGVKTNPFAYMRKILSLPTL